MHHEVVKTKSNFWISLVFSGDEVFWCYQVLPTLPLWWYLPGLRHIRYMLLCAIELQTCLSEVGPLLRQSIATHHHSHCSIPNHVHQHLVGLGWDRCTHHDFEHTFTTAGPPDLGLGV